MSVVIPRNTPIPCVKTQTYTTEANYQTKVDVSVYEGERLKSDENNMLGEFTISGIESAKRGEPQVDVAFSIDSNGILNIGAKETATGRSKSITITNEKGRLSQEEIERMVKEAEKYAAEDEEQKGKIEAKNGLENYAYSMRNSINDEKLKDKLEAEDRETIETAINETTTWLDANQLAEKEEFDAKQKELEAICNPIMMKVYQGAGGEGGMPEGGMPGGMPGGDGGGDAGGAGPTIDEVD